MPAGLVRQRAEHGVDVVELGEPRADGSGQHLGLGEVRELEAGPAVTRFAQRLHALPDRADLRVLGSRAADASASIHSKIATTSGPDPSCSWPT